jgi:hypothetical protein
LGALSSLGWVVTWANMLSISMSHASILNAVADVAPSSYTNVKAVHVNLGAKMI